MFADFFVGLTLPSPLALHLSEKADKKAPGLLFSFGTSREFISPLHRNFSQSHPLVWGKVQIYSLCFSQVIPDLLVPVQLSQ